MAKNVSSGVAAAVVVGGDGEARLNHEGIRDQQSTKMKFILIKEHVRRRDKAFCCSVN